MKDADIETYLNLMDRYITDKQTASDSWKSAFIELTAARLTERSGGHVGESLTSLDFDTRSTAGIQYRDGEIETSNHNGGGLIGAWPSSALKKAQQHFDNALKLEVNCNSLVSELDKVEHKLYSSSTNPKESK